MNFEWASEWALSRTSSEWQAILGGSTLNLFLILRFMRHDSTARLDLFLLFVGHGWAFGSLRAIPLHLTLSFLAASVFTLFRLLSEGTSLPGRVSMEEQTPNTHDQSLRMRPLLISSRTVHSRVFPEKHTFSYSYLLVGIPVGWKGIAGSMVSAGTFLGLSSRAWFHVDAADHLSRDEGENKDLLTKLTEYLRGQGVKDSEWQTAYLVTAPSFLGYNFNPVSFWYIYSSNEELKMMVLEVNNTFDERRPYLLKITSDSRNSEAATGLRKRPEETVFCDSWKKDFHVSPFNSRKGSYSITAENPFAKSVAPGKISNAITLWSSKGNKKLVARIFSIGNPADPKELSRWQQTRFIWQWWWVGFMTFPRILKEAARLYYTRGLHVWFRPEVLPSSVGRVATEAEKAIEPFFAQFLSCLVKQAGSPIRVTYYAACNDTSACQFSSLDPPILSDGRSDNSRKTLEIRILSPVFYTRLVHYVHISEAFDREGAFTDVKNRTLWVSDPALLIHILPQRPQLSRQPVASKSLLSRLVFDRLSGLCWNILRILRCPPPPQSYQNAGLSPGSSHTCQDIRPSSFSDLDKFVRAICSNQALYCRALMETFLVERLAFGAAGILRMADIGVRVVLTFISVNMLWAEEGNEHGLIKWIPIGLLVNAMHFWSFAKGA